ncbi:MAG TPA: hypothetical protein PLG37_01615, partial [Candidatus Pacearchaeota archaeon]|nr:hypothetical protein [Candidatus Pacearchaeota archaeon]
MGRNYLKLFLLLIGLPIIALGTEINYPDLPGLSDTEGMNFFIYLYNLLVYCGGIIAVIVIIYQGIRFLISQGNVAKTSLAKDRIKSALLGLVILFGSYLILQAVNPELTKINFDVVISNVHNIVNPRPNFNPKVAYKEIPLGAIIESILMPVSTTDGQAYNYSQVIKQNSSVKKTEELCFLYDKETGDTIDRNNDGKIDGKDAVEGLEMSICLDNLLAATIKKIELLNGNGRELCGNSSASGPINLMKKYIRDGCSCKPCSEWPDITYPPFFPVTNQPYYTDGCYTTPPQDYTCLDSNGDSTSGKVTRCDNKCACCGSPRGADSGCQTTPANPFYQNNSSNYAPRDPCVSRPLIDCARQELNYRLYGTGLGLGLHCDGLSMLVNGEHKTFEYGTDIKPFIDEDNNKLREVVNGESFLTIKQIYNPTDGGRIGTFKKYFEQRFQDLEKAKQAMNDKNKNVLSLAEFQELQENSSDEIGVDYLFPDTYDSASYHTFTACTAYKNGDKNKLCLKGELQELKKEGYAFMPGQPYNNIETLGEGRYTGLTTVDNTNYKNDDKAGGWPFTAKRLWTSTLSKANRDSDVYNSGDPATFYVLSNPGATDKSKYSKAALKGLIDYSPTDAQCTLKKGEVDVEDPFGVKQIYKESLISNIPIGKLADSISNYVDIITKAIDDISKEVQNTINAADQIANQLPEQCQCSNCANEDICNVNGVEKIGSIAISQATAGCPPAPQTCGGCTECTQPTHETCNVSCITCGTTQLLDSAYYTCIRDKRVVPFMHYDFDTWTPGTTAPIWARYCVVTNSAGDYSSEYLLKNPNLTITSLNYPWYDPNEPKKCGCPEKNGFKYISSEPPRPASRYPSDYCYKPLYGELYAYSPNKPTMHDVPGILCSTQQIEAWSYYGVNYQEPNMCLCIYDANDPDKNCQNLDCSVKELLDDGYAPGSECEVIAAKMPKECVKNIQVVDSLGPFWTIDKCTDNIMTIKPSAILPAQTVCVGEYEDSTDTGFTDGEKQTIANLNPSKNLIWQDDGTVAYASLDCCDVYGDYVDQNGNWINPTDYSSPWYKKNMKDYILKVPSGWAAYCIPPIADSSVYN